VEEIAAEYLAQRSVDGETDRSAFRDRLATPALQREFDELVQLADTAIGAFPRSGAAQPVPSSRAEPRRRRLLVGLAAAAVAASVLGWWLLAAEVPDDRARILGLRAVQLTMQRQGTVCALLLERDGADAVVALAPVRVRRAGAAPADGAWVLPLAPGEHALMLDAPADFDDPRRRVQPCLFTAPDDRLEELWSALAATVAPSGRGAVAIDAVRRTLDTRAARGGGAPPLSLAELVGTQPCAARGIARLASRAAQ
jgi:hypothetical protein